MRKIIQIATCAAENGHSLYALTEEGKVYERVYHLDGIKSTWQEIVETIYENPDLLSTPQK